MHCLVNIGEDPPRPQHSLAHSAQRSSATRSHSALATPAKLTAHGSAVNVDLTAQRLYLAPSETIKTAPSPRPRFTAQQHTATRTTHRTACLPPPPESQRRREPLGATKQAKSRVRPPAQPAAGRP